MKESKRITKRVGKPYPDVFQGSKVEMQVTVVEASKDKVLHKSTDTCPLDSADPD